MPWSAAGTFHSRPWKTRVSRWAARARLMSGLTFSTPILACRAAVVGDDHPVQAVPGALADLVGDAVLAVAAVVGVDVVVAREPQEVTPRASYGARGGGAAAALPDSTVPAARPAPSRPARRNRARRDACAGSSASSGTEVSKAGAGAPTRRARGRGGGAVRVRARARARAPRLPPRLELRRSGAFGRRVNHGRPRSDRRMPPTRRLRAARAVRVVPRAPPGARASNHYPPAGALQPTRPVGYIHLSETRPPDSRRHTSPAQDSPPTASSRPPPTSPTRPATRTSPCPRWPGGSTSRTRACTPMCAGCGTCAPGWRCWRAAR